MLGRPHDYRVDGFRANLQALDFFARLPIGAAELPLVEMLDLDGGNPIFKYIGPNWQGYSDGIGDIEHLDDLDDIALLADLMDFGASACLPTKVDFALFRDLARLQRLHATFDAYSHIETLIQLPSLASVEFMGDRIYEDVTTPETAARVPMEVLRARGVTIRVIYVSPTIHPARRRLRHSASGMRCQPGERVVLPSPNLLAALRFR